MGDVGQNNLLDCEKMPEFELFREFWKQLSFAQSPDRANKLASSEASGEIFRRTPLRKLDFRDFFKS